MTTSEWTDELKAKVIEAYTSKNPTPETSVGILEELSEEFGKTVNGVRIILSRAGVYVKKDTNSPSGGSAGTSTTKTKRVSKADSVAKLTSIIESQGAEVDAEIIGKLTGKAAIYFFSVIEAIISEDTDDE